MAETRVQGPGGYAEVRATADTPHPQDLTPAAPAVSAPFTPPDTSAMGYGQSGGGSTGPGGNRGGSLADKISGIGEEAGEAAPILEDVAELAPLAAL